MVEFPASTLPARLKNAGCNAKRIVLVDVDVPRLQSLSGSVGDVAVIAVVTWLFSAVKGKFTVLAVQDGVNRSAGRAQRVCRIAQEALNESVTQGDILNAAQAASLQRVLRTSSGFPDSTAAEDSTTTVAQVLNIRDSYSAPPLAELEFFRTPLSNEVEYLSSLAEGEMPPILVHARDIAVCAVKSHVLYEQQLLPGASAETPAMPSVLTELVRQCEGAGAPVRHAFGAPQCPRAVRVRGALQRARLHQALHPSERHAHRVQGGRARAARPSPRRALSASRAGEPVVRQCAPAERRPVGGAERRQQHLWRDGLMHSMSTEAGSLVDRKVCSSKEEVTTDFSIKQFSACFQTHVGDLYHSQAAFRIAEKITFSP
jgi:hypothetical protein